MCTSIIHNGKKTIVGWNLDILDMKYQVVATKDIVSINIEDKKEGWLPLFGANNRGDFVAMPTCWPFDERSNPKSSQDKNIINLDIDLLLKKKTFTEIKEIAEKEKIYSIPGVTFQSSLSDREGNVLQIISGQGYKFKERPRYSILTNFSPFKADKELHPWMGLDRYETAKQMLESANEDFGVENAFAILKSTAQKICPTVVSMVFDVNANKVYWCENREWNNRKEQQLFDDNIAIK